jgi:LysR family transcriptional regulator, glycine cleavage system transcriptional activator
MRLRTELSETMRPQSAKKWDLAARQSFVPFVASPTFIAADGTFREPHDLLRASLLWVDWGPDHGEPPTWREWFKKFAVHESDVPCDLTYFLSSAALEGRSAMLAQHSMVTGPIARGSLVRLFDLSLPLPEDYFIAWSGRALDQSHGIAFHAWLMNEAL